MNPPEQSNQPPSPASTGEGQAGRNGVVIPRYGDTRSRTRFRTYEVYQRERVGQSTEKIKPLQLTSDTYRTDPYPLLEILREHYPCYRDWLANCFWVTRYDDVTSLLADEANFATRSKAWAYGQDDFGRDFGQELVVLEAQSACLKQHAQIVAARLAHAMQVDGGGDLVAQFAARLPLEILVIGWGIPAADVDQFVGDYWSLQRGTSWHPQLQQRGQEAWRSLLTYLDDLLQARRADPGEDLVSVLAQLTPAEGPVTAADVLRTLLETDHQTLQGALSNLWYLLLTHPQEFDKARSEQRLMKLAYLETLRHSAPVLSAHRFSRHEVERFGRLLPAGALVVCSAAAANRDPRIFKNPEAFIVDRQDLCQREPRGQYRADGLASGIAVALGAPSKHPAIPEDRPASRYALTRDAVVTAAQVLLDTLGDVRLAAGAEPRLAALTVGEMHTCWSLPVEVTHG